MTPFESRYWNLAQAAAWVVYRNRSLVEEFEYPTRDAWPGLVMYPKMHGYMTVESLDVLRVALREGKLVAHARRNSAGSEYGEVPAIEWADLILRPPTAYRSDPKLGRIEPYSALQFESKQLKKLWPIGKRPKKIEWYDWGTIRPIWECVETEFANLTGRKKFEQFSVEYEKRFGRKPPSRASLQRHIKQWQLAHDED